MKKLLNVTFYKAKILPTLIILIALVFAGLVAYAFSPKTHLENTSKIKVQTAKVLTQKQIKTIPSPPKKVLGASIYNPLPSPKPSITVNNSSTIPQQVVLQNSNSANTNSDNSDTVSIIPTATPTPTVQPPASPTVSPTQISTVSLQIQSPDGTSNFSVKLKDRANVCDVLQEAKDEGKINSVTFDDSYMSSLHSKYVYEINGYKNNWTFTVNGNAPLGCSLSNPKPNDSIVWKFG